jgi:hypothetical protein
MFLSWKGRPVQIIPGAAPAALAALLRWSQHHLDELEFVEALVALEEMHDALHTAVPCPATEAAVTPAVG